MPSLRSRIVRLVIKYSLGRAVANEPPVAERRRRLERSAAWARLPRGTQIEPVVAGGVPGEWVGAPGVAGDRVVLYLHGGSYAIGSPRTHRALTAYLARACGTRLLVLDYRLAPEHVFPAALEDAVAAYRWLVAEGIAPGHVVIAGDSAGGGLTVATAVALRDAGDLLPTGLVCLSPWTDLAGASLVTRAKADPWLKPDGIAAAGKIYLGDQDPRTPLASPLYADLHGLPPMLIQVGDDEILLDDSTRLAERARAAGVTVMLDVWPGMWHVWQAVPGFVPEARQAIEAIGKFVRQRMA